LPVARGQPRQQRDHAAHVQTQQRPPGTGTRRRDLEQAHRAAWPQHAVELAERCPQVGQVPERIAERQEVERRIGERQASPVPSTSGVASTRRARTTMPAEDRAR
jgi:hypothetical protein